MPYYTIMVWILDDINLHNDVSKKWADGEQVEVIIMLAAGICSLNREWNYLVIVASRCAQFNLHPPLNIN